MDIIKINMGQYNNIIKNNEDIQAQKQVLEQYKKLKDEEIRKSFYSFSPQASMDMVAFIELGLPQNTLLYKDTGFFYMYNDKAFIEGAFIGDDVFRIMNVNVFEQFRCKGVGTKILKRFLDAVICKFRVYAFFVSPKDPYAPASQKNQHTEKLIEFFGYQRFKLTDWGVDMVKPIEINAYNKDFMLHVLDLHYGFKIIIDPLKEAY